jgi:Family of unknown function (DUF6196)
MVLIVIVFAIESKVIYSSSIQGGVTRYKEFIKMYVSQESSTETEQRLLKVFRLARFELMEAPYYFLEVPVSEFHTLNPNALALVRDHSVWSQLLPCTINDDAEKFCLFSFHFVEGVDNSGFVGWLANKFKLALGTGVFVTCGQNSQEGGIFDYWGVPEHLRQETIILLDSLHQ